MLSVLNKKKDGFIGQKAVVIPRQLLAKQSSKNTVIAGLYLTDIGFYPKAKFHYRQRANGADQHILIYCIEGKGYLDICNKKHNIGAGNFFIIPKNIAHTYRADEDDPWTIYWIHFKGIHADAIVEQLVDRLDGYHSFLRFNEERIHLFNTMYTFLEKGYSLDNLLYVNMCLWHYLTSFIFSDKFNDYIKASTLNSSDHAIELMQKKIGETLTLEDIAQQVNLWVSHFSFLFKKETGFSPIEYFIHLKVQKACQYLLFTELRIKEIALKLGIDDPYYFSRIFTKIMGLSPNDYRKKRSQ